MQYIHFVIQIYSHFCGILFQLLHIWRFRLPNLFPLYQTQCDSLVFHSWLIFWWMELQAPWSSVSLTKNPFLPASLLLIFSLLISVCAVRWRDSSPRTRPKTIWPFTNRNWTGNKGSGFSRYLFIITPCRFIYLCYKEELLVNQFDFVGRMC